MMPMLGILLLASLESVTPVAPPDSIFAELVAATERNDEDAMTRLLGSETLSTSTGSVDDDGRLSGGPMRHGVSAIGIAKKLRGCAVERWQDRDSRFARAFVLWECPSSRVPGNDCYYYSYRAARLDPDSSTSNLFVHELPKRDLERCGRFLPPPPRP